MSTPPGVYVHVPVVGGMVSRENAIVLVSGSAALLLGYGGLWLTDLATEVLIGTILFVGVVAPQLVNEYLDRT
mgnify:FL=1